MRMSHFDLKASEACFPWHPGGGDLSINRGKRMKAVYAKNAKGSSCGMETANLRMSSRAVKMFSLFSVRKDVRLILTLN